MYRFLFRLLFLMLCLAGIVYLWETQVKKRLSFWGETTAETNHHMVLQEMSQLGKLELVKYNFRDVVEHEVVKPLFPNAKVLLIVQGEATGCIDLTKVQVADIASTDDTLVVHLPEPEICSFKIDHAKSRIYNTEYAFMDEAQMIDEAFKQAEGKIQESALQMGIIEQTRHNAEVMLKPLLEQVSRKKVLLRYRLKATVQYHKK